MIVHLLSEVYSYDVSCSIRRAISIATLNLTFCDTFFFVLAVPFSPCWSSKYGLCDGNKPRVFTLCTSYLPVKGHKSHDHMALEPRPVCTRPCVSCLCFHLSCSYFSSSWSWSYVSLVILSVGRQHLLRAFSTTRHLDEDVVKRSSIAFSMLLIIIYSTWALYGVWSHIFVQLPSQVPFPFPFLFSRRLGIMCDSGRMYDRYNTGLQPS